jgi:hypothetical protein
LVQEKHLCCPRGTNAMHSALALLFIVYMIYPWSIIQDVDLILAYLVERTVCALA